MRTDRKVILVTGAGAGIGAALVRELAGRGRRVYAGVRNMSRAESDFADLKDNPDFSLLALDVNDPGQCAAALGRIRSEAGELDVLVNNAGYGYYGAFEELTEEGFRAQMETNFFAPLRLMWSVLPAMRGRGRGLVLNVTSILGRLVIPTGSAYTASKFALEAATEVVRYEMAPFGVDVCAIEPGLIRTNFKNNMQYGADIKDAASPYDFLNARIGSDYRTLSTSAEACARRIARIVDKRKPGARYLIGLDAKMAALAVRCLPQRAVDFILRSFLKRAHKNFRRS